jgi:hypothetical protein
MAKQFRPRLQAQTELAVVDLGDDTQSGRDIEIVIEQVRRQRSGTLSARPPSPPVAARGPIPDKVDANGSD